MKNVKFVIQILVQNDIQQLKIIMHQHCKVLRLVEGARESTSLSTPPLSIPYPDLNRDLNMDLNMVYIPNLYTFYTVSECLYSLTVNGLIQNSATAVLHWLGPALV